MTLVPPPPSLPPPDDPSETCYECYPDMETPLVNHTSSIKKPYARDSVFRSNLPTCYSSISDNGLSDECYDADTNDEDDERSIASFSTAASIATNFRENLLLPFTDEQGSPSSIVRGLAALMLVGVVVGLVMPKNAHLYHGSWPHWYPYVSSIIGYTYVVLWSVCFYPQVLLNYRRKSTKGLSSDFAVLNLMGWSFYSAYLCSMYFDAEIKTMYKERFTNESSTVASNDVAFSVHAMLLSATYLIQIMYYSGSWSLHLKPQTWVLVLGMLVPSVITPLLIASGTLAYTRWLDYFYVLSFFKIGCTVTKYTKQVLLNWSRQSTKGWNIWYNFLECAGGVLSMLQIVLDSMDMNDLTGITGNLAKFALGFATISFDAIFFTQHYVLYPSEPEPSEHTSFGTIKASDRFDIICLSSDEMRTYGTSIEDDEEDLDSEDT